MLRPNILDCTLRDGGYYNNWFFSKLFVEKYINIMSLVNVNYIELGFRFLDKDKIRGPNAYTRDHYINSLSIPKKTKIGVMINAIDFVGSDYDIKKKINIIFPKLKNSRIDFIRIACHADEIFKIGHIINFLQKLDRQVMINIMQISEIKEKNIKDICAFLKKNKIGVLYLADSLGCLKPSTFLNIIKKFRKYWNGSMGVHTHDNMNYALSNSIAAYKAGVKWIDGTVLGMGRGAGNVKTEDLVTFFNKRKNKELDNFSKKYLEPLKKKYNWGGNKYYKIAAINKIHPTYVQLILSDQRYKNLNLIKILFNLKKINSIKFDPYNLHNSLLNNHFYKKNNLKFKTLNKKEFLLIGSANISKKIKQIESLISNNNFYVIALNSTKHIKENLIDLRVACHPLRILSEIESYKKINNNMVIPFNFLPKKFFNLIKSKKNIFNYEIKLCKKNENIIINQKYSKIPYILGVSYGLAIAVAAKCRSVTLIGFNQYKKNDILNDETKKVLFLYKKRFNNIKFNIIN
jgi:4-hydroxy 2-oxovalerate aldolase